MTNKRGNYFIAMYDLNDNYITEFNSIEECAIYFKTTKQNIKNYIFKKKKMKNEYRLFKINDDQTINKSL